MRVVFMGTPDFAVPSLQALCENGHEVTLVVTQPDKPQGRKQILTPSPVKEESISAIISAPSLVVTTLISIHFFIIIF